MEEKRALIIAGGTVSKRLLQKIVQRYSFNLVICADAGLEAAEAHGLKVDYIVGDFDSVPENILDKYKNKSGPIIQKFNPEKDFTDTQIAMELALKENADSILLIGATGTRFDHCLGNVHILMLALNARKRAYVLDENNCIYLINKGITIEKKKVYGKYVSLIPFTEEVKKVTLKGFHYPLENHTLLLGNSLGISNEIEEEVAEISFEKGILVVIESMD